MDQFPGQDMNLEVPKRQRNYCRIERVDHDLGQGLILKKTQNPGLAQEVLLSQGHILCQVSILLDPGQVLENIHDLNLVLGAHQDQGPDQHHHAN